MRALRTLGLAALCACSSARPRSAREAACTALPLAGRVAPAALAADGAGGIALAGTLEAGTLRSGSSRLDGPGGFVLRADAGGVVLWLKSLAGARPLAAAIAPDLGVVVVGEAGGRCFATRLDASGRETWATALGGEGSSACRAVAIDEGTGTIWAAADFSGTVGPVRSRGMTDAVLLRIDGHSGEMRLGRVFAGTGAEIASAVAVTGTGEIAVAGSFGGAPGPPVDLGRGPVPTAGGTDGFLVGIAADGITTRWVSIVGEHGDDDVVAIAARQGQVYAAANVHREQRTAPCGGEVLLLRNGDWVRVSDEECLAARALAFDDEGRLWMLENARRTLRARAFSPADGEQIGIRSWGSGTAGVRGAGIAAVPGGLAIAAITDGELVACGKPIGSSGEETAFVLWIRDL